MIITLYESPKYDSCVYIKNKNRNYEQLEIINNIIINNNLSWYWLIEYTGIATNIIKSYFSDKGTISLRSVELISIALSDYIISPKDIMNPNFPILNKGRYFQLNVDTLCKKYGITNDELIVKAHLDKGNHSRIRRHKSKEIRVETLKKF